MTSGPRLFLRLAFLAVSCLALVEPLWAQRPAKPDQPRRLYSISGFVHLGESLQQGAAQSRIELRDARGLLIRQKVTDSDGRFVFEGLGNGNYTLVVQQSGYLEAREEVTVHEAPVPMVMLSLRLDPNANPEPSLAGTISRQALAVPPKARSQYEKGVRELFEKRSSESSLSYFRKALELHPDYADAYYAMGIAQMNLKQTPEAEESLQKAIERDANHAPAHAALGAIYNLTRRPKPAQDALTKALSLNPASWQTNFEMAKACLALQDLTCAEEKARRAAELHSPLPAASLVLADVAVGRQNWSEAAQHLENFLKFEPNSPHAPKIRESMQKFRARAEGRP